MKIFENKEKIGEAVEVSDGFLIRLPNENRVMFIAKADIIVEQPASPLAYHRRTKYLRMRYDEKMGKALQTPLALKCYKQYGVRLFNNILRDIMSAINSVKVNEMKIADYKKIYEYIFSKYGIQFTESKYGAYSLFVREAGLVKIVRGQKKHAMYVINHQPEIPKTE